MAQRQFRSDDTSPWQEKYGNGQDGALTISSDTTQSPIDAAFTGTQGASTGSGTNASFAAGQIVVIIQSQGTGASGAPNWELNTITNYSSGTITFKYPLTLNYTSGAQIIVVPQYTTVTIDATKTHTAKAWDGSTGGVYVIAAVNSVTVNGAITAQGKGFRGGGVNVGPVDVSSYTGLQGETYSGLGSNTTSANNTGGGGGNYSGDNGNSAAGGGYSSGGGNGSGGAGGGTAGIANLTTLIFGGGGGQGGIGAGAHGDPVDGANGGGIVIIIAPIITVHASTGTINANGNNGSSINNGFFGANGGGAGGSVLLKGQVITLNTTRVTASPGNGGTNGSGPSGGIGGQGRIHIDYVSTLTGTTSPTLDSTVDPTLVVIFGALLFFTLL